MTWSSFLTLLTVVYALYYGANILYDSFGKAKTTDTETPTLKFEGISTIQPTVIGEDCNEEKEEKSSVKDKEPDPKTENGTSSKMANDSSSDTVYNEEKENVQKQKREPPSEHVPNDPSQSSGGVPIKEMLKLYREKAIVASRRFDFAT